MMNLIVLIQTETSLNQFSKAGAVSKYLSKLVSKDNRKINRIIEHQSKVNQQWPKGAFKIQGAS